MALGYIGDSNIKALVIPPSISNIHSDYSYSTRGRLKVYLSNKLSYKLKYAICCILLGLGQNKEFDGDFKKVKGLLIY